MLKLQNNKQYLSERDLGIELPVPDWEIIGDLWGEDLGGEAWEQKNAQEGCYK